MSFFICKMLQIPLLMVCGKNEIIQSMSSTGPSPEKMFGRWYLIFFINCYFFFFLLHCVSIAMWGLSLVTVSRSCSSLHIDMWAFHCRGFSCCGPQALGSRLRSCGLKAPELQLSSCSELCVIFLDQGSNICPLHWQVNSWPLDHQGSP